MMPYGDADKHDATQERRPGTAPALHALKHVLVVLGQFHAGSESTPDLRPGALLGTRTEAEQFLAHRHAPRCSSALRSATPRHESPFRQTASATSTEVGGKHIHRRAPLCPFGTLNP